MNLIKTVTLLIITGLAAVFIGTLFSTQKANIGGLIMIGPIPIAFGTSPEVTIIAMILGILLMILFFIIGRRNETMRQIGIPAQDTAKVPETKMKGGGVVFIGPIPIIFGSDKRFAIIAILLTIVLMLLAIFFH